uniref:Uncharacterized protein n=1 Tax=Siphoviridae sp. ct2vX3 TaxID=2825318 RepID=A0A8S5PYC4_9CAUD|nr:MAG TPA: hypothetical protein [Siphoviridae sp. ct2vX3]
MKNLLTNPTECGTIKMSRGTAKSCRLKKILEFLEKNSPNLLTNPTKCAII